MERYATVLLTPVVRICVVLGFLCLLVASLLSCLQLRQNFEIQDIIPRVSYVRDYLVANEIYYNDTGSFTGEVYFRYVDHSNHTNRQAMKEYIASLNELPFVEEIPSTSMWMSVFDLNLALVYPDLVDAPFPEQVEAFLATELNFNAFRQNLVLDDAGNIIASKIPISMRADFTDVFDQIGVLQNERNLTFSLDVNQGREEDLAFFTFADIYTVFEFYLVCVAELISTTIYGVISVTLVALLFIPHWSAVLFICPMICVLYVDLLGVIQWAGLFINSLTYLGLTMSIGLLVDFIMHVLFRYYEVPGNRVEKTKEMLKTMGTSILLGGVTTFLGIIPLYFTSSNAFRVIFTTFVGIVTLGVGHGLVLMPVLLATFGPETQVSMSFHRDKDNKPEAADRRTSKVIVKKVGAESGFGDVEEEIFTFQNAVKSLTDDKERRFNEILEFVLDYAQAAGIDPEFVLQRATWGSPDGEASVEDGEEMHQKKATFGHALAELFRFAEEHGLDAHAALRKSKESTYFNLQNKNIRAESFVPLRDFDGESDYSENEC